MFHGLVRRSFVMNVVLAAFAGGSGCGPAPRDTASIEGTVTHNGKPVEKQHVVFTSKTAGASATAPLEDGGKFKVAGLLAPGSYVVTIQPPPPSPMEPAVKL